MLNMYIRIAQIIKSCETIPQLKAARKYLNLWFNTINGCEARLCKYEEYLTLDNEINYRIKALENV